MKKFVLALVSMAIALCVPALAAQPVIVQVTGCPSTGAATTNVCTLTRTTLAGNLVILIGASGSAALDTPSGFTALDPDGGCTHTSSWYQVASSPLTSITMSDGGSAANWGGIVIVVAKLNESTPFDGHGLATCAASPSTQSLTPSQSGDGALFYISGGSSSFPRFTSIPAGVLPLNFNMAGYSSASSEFLGIGFNGNYASTSALVNTATSTSASIAAGEILINAGSAGNPGTGGGGAGSCYCAGGVIGYGDRVFEQLLTLI